MTQKLKIKFDRLIVYPKDIIRINGCSSATASRKIKLVKDVLGKQDHQALTIEEYCTYYGLDFIAIMEFLEL
ncbi:MAG: hypothetical protein ACOYKE_02490 [Ferruginibacter sp.]